MMSKENNHNKRPLEKATEQQGQKKRKGLKDITNTSESSANPQQKSNYFDIDKLNAKNPSYVTTYSKDIYPYLYQKESIIRDYIHDQTFVTTKMREMLMEWLSDVVSQYELSLQTLFLGKKIVDVILSKKLFFVKNLQLLGATSLFIASKFEDVHPPSIDELYQISAFNCKKKKIKNMELYILKKLSYDIIIPTEIDFLPRYLNAAIFDLSDRNKRGVCFLANYFCEVTILYYTFIKYKSSTIAMVSVSLALATLGEKMWTPTLNHYFPSRDDDFNMCMHELLEHIRLEDDNGIKEKYASPHFGSVSTFRFPDAVPYLTFE